MKQVLFVEDDPFLIEIYKGKLREAGFEPRIALDGKEALDIIKERKPDLLLLDIVLPQIDGWELLKKIKEDENLRDLKVLILSNLSQKTEIEKGLALGAVKHLIKAKFTPGEVIKEIKKILK